MELINVPLNHKTILLFDHSVYFGSPCGQTIEIDVGPSGKPGGGPASAAAAAAYQKFDPLMKTMWTCNVEAALEFSRVVYDIFPEHKLIRLVVSKVDAALNGWIEAEQGQEHLMNMLGNIPPPASPQTALQNPQIVDVEFISLCQALRTCVNSLVQASPLQQGFCARQPLELVPNSGRIVLFSHSKLRDFDKIQEFLAKTIEECNKTVEQLQKSESLPLGLLKINKIELVIVDVVQADKHLPSEKETLKHNSAELRTRVLCSHSGRYLPLKMIQMAQKFYELGVTSVTNIPMKEELNANSSANYDVDILHPKCLHDQLKIYGLMKHCVVPRDGVDTVCLKWSNPKTNITDFNFTNCSFRITPIDVNSRPASCLTSFLLGGRCVVLEVVVRSQNNARIATHVLCNHGNELFMHCLNCCGKSNLEERPSIESMTTLGRLIDYRTAEFSEFIKSNTLAGFAESEKPSAYIPKILARLEKTTRKWPLIYSDNLITNLQPMKALVAAVATEGLSDAQYNECIRVIEACQLAEHKNESIIAAGNLLIQAKPYRNIKKKDQYKMLWSELESYLRAHQELSDKHAMLYRQVKEIRHQHAKSENLLNFELSLLNNAGPSAKKPAPGVGGERQSQAGAGGAPSLDIGRIMSLKARMAAMRQSNFERDFENEKLCKQRRYAARLGEIVTASQASAALKRDPGNNLLEVWHATIAHNSAKPKLDFYARSICPTNQAPLYVNLKLDEAPGFAANQSAKSLLKQ